MRNYKESEVRGLVENYQELTHRRRYNDLHAKLMDIDSALKLLRKLQPKAYLAVLLVGLAGLDVRTAGALVGVSKDTVHRQYVHAIKTMTDYLNVGRKR